MTSLGDKVRADDVRRAGHSPQVAHDLENATEFVRSARWAAISRGENAEEFCRRYANRLIDALDYLTSRRSPPVVEEEGAWHYDLDAVPRDRDFLIQYDHKEVTLGHYLDNSKTQWPYEGIRPCRSMRPERVSEKIIAWRELPPPETAGSSDLAVASPNGEHLRPLADREKSAATPVPEPQAVAWRIDTDDQVELLAKECGINNRRYMTPKDYSIWCEQQRQFARLAAAPLSGGGKVEVTNGVVDAQWQWLCDKDDRSSPVEYPDMALVTRDELGEIIVAVLSTMGGKQP